MKIAPPSESELNALLGEHAHRYPEKASISVVGDGGATVRLPILIGNPKGSGATDTKPSPVWGALVVKALGLPSGKDVGRLGAKMAEDALLWPDPGTWSSWVNRWPALGDAVGEGVASKACASAGAITEPDGETPPAEIESFLKGNPAAVWMWLGTRDRYAVALLPPNANAWKLFKDSVNKPGANPWVLALDLAKSCTRVCVGMSPAELFDRYPGLVFHVVARLGALIGASAEVELGNW